MKQNILFLTIVVFLAGCSSCTLDKKIARTNKRNFSKAPYDAIIVPGYPYVTDAYPYGTERNKALLNVRLYFAKELYDKGIAKNIIFSGAAVHTPYVEGKVLKIMADSLGIPPEHTFVEDAAEHSNENAIYSRKLAKKLGFKRIAVATDPYQYAYMTFLVKVFTPGMPILTFPTEDMVKYILPLPSINADSAFVQHFVPLDER